MMFLWYVIITNTAAATKTMMTTRNKFDNDCGWSVNPSNL